MGGYPFTSVGEGAPDISGKRGGELATAIVDAVVLFCAGVLRIITTGKQQAAVKGRVVLNFGNSINQAGSIHRTQAGVSACSRGGRKERGQLTVRNLAGIPRSVSAHLARRNPRVEAKNLLSIPI